MTLWRHHYGAYKTERRRFRDLKFLFLFLLNKTVSESWRSHAALLKASQPGAHRRRRRVQLASGKMSSQNRLLSVDVRRTLSCRALKHIGCNNSRLSGRRRAVHRRRNGCHSGWRRTIRQTYRTLRSMSWNSLARMIRCIRITGQRGESESNAWHGSLFGWDGSADDL